MIPPLPPLPPDGPPPPESVRTLLGATGAYLDSGHFVLTSGLHSDRFFLLPLALAHPPVGAWLGRALAQLGKARLGAAPPTVVGPAMGGVLLGYEVARAVGARAMYAEKTPQGTMELRRGFRLSPGEKVWVVEDAVTTGGSVERTLEAVARAGGRPEAVLALVYRGQAEPSFARQLPFAWLLREEAPAWPPALCPLCQAGIPWTAPKEASPPLAPGGDP
jgi:orotate phosphoribosyltransferase